MRSCSMGWRWSSMVGGVVEVDVRVVDGRGRSLAATVTPSPIGSVGLGWGVVTRSCIRGHDRATALQRREGAEGHQSAAIGVRPEESARPACPPTLWPIRGAVGQGEWSWRRVEMHRRAWHHRDVAEAPDIDEAGPKGCCCALALAGVPGGCRRSVLGSDHDGTSAPREHVPEFDRTASVLRDERSTTVAAADSFLPAPTIGASASNPSSVTTTTVKRPSPTTTAPGMSGDPVGQMAVHRRRLPADHRGRDFDRVDHRRRSSCGSGPAGAGPRGGPVDRAGRHQRPVQPPSRRRRHHPDRACTP